jgi:RNA polymerase sigma-70 factor (ECF subfamily)
VGAPRGKAAKPRVDHAQARDEELVERLVARDERALEVLYEKYGRATYSLVLKMLRDPARAEEIAQEVFLKLWRRPSSYVAGRGTFATWLLSVAHHRAVDELRTRRHEMVPLGDGTNGTPELVDETADLAEAAWVREQRVVVRQALGLLPVSQRQAIEMAYFLGLTQREIAERLGEPLGTIKTRMRLAMQKLRVSLDDLAAQHGHANGLATVPILSNSERGARHADV